MMFTHKTMHTSETKTSIYYVDLHCRNGLSAKNEIEMRPTRISEARDINTYHVVTETLL